MTEDVAEKYRYFDTINYRSVAIVICNEMIALKMGQKNKQNKIFLPSAVLCVVWLICNVKSEEEKIGRKIERGKKIRFCK